ncbi:MAG: GNAT family N-acetyltransferase [Pseudoxanthomonas mexicana]|nr:GNAT family N-acetyltransferase [Pseudoxanthomonas mexicana]
MSSRMRPEAKEIRLRLLDSRDKALYLFAFTDRGMMRFVGEPVGDERAEKAFSRACALNLMQNLKARTWVVEVGPSGDAAGLLSISVKGASAEIGGMILPRWQGLGISGAVLATQ